MHGIPGIIGAIAGSIAASMSYVTFDTAQQVADVYPMVTADGLGRTSEEQGWIQLAALGVTLAISILGGAFAGFVSSRGCSPTYFFDDQMHWEHVSYEDPSQAYGGKNYVHPKSLSMRQPTPSSAF